MMQENIKDQIIKLKTNILRARFNLMFMVILSAVNVLSVLSGNEAFMPFSMSISSFSATLGAQLSTEQGNNLFLYAGIITASIILCTILLCYFKSKNNPIFFVAALGIVFVDTLALLLIAIGGLFYNTSFIVDLIVHIMTLVFLSSALKSHKELGVIEKLSLESLDLSESILNITETEEISEDYLDDYSDDGIEPIVSATYEDTEVFAVVSEEKAELIINGRVCDSLDASYTAEYELSAIVDGVEFNFQYKRTYSGETAYLYADNILLDSFARDFF